MKIRIEIPIVDCIVENKNILFLSFSGFFGLEGCIVAWRDVLKNAFPLAYKVQKM